MANVSNLKILNGADKARHYTVAMGGGAPAETTDPLVADIKKFPAGSLYVNTTSGIVYARKAVAKAVADWQAQSGPGEKGDAGDDGLFTTPLANCADYTALKTAMIAAGLMAAE